MDFLVVLWKSILSIIILFFLTKVMGRKQISQLSLYDYVVGITIGSVAAEISTNMDANFWGGVLVMVVYTSVSILASLMTEKSILLRRSLKRAKYWNHPCARQNLMSTNFYRKRGLVGIMI